MFIHVVDGEAHECNVLHAVEECDSKEVKMAYQTRQMTPELWASIDVYEIADPNLDNAPDHDPWTQTIEVSYAQQDGVWGPVLTVVNRSAEEIAELAEMRTISEANDLL